MNIQYLEDKDGKLTGVFIPIEDWEEISKKGDIEDIDVPEWHKEVVREREKKGEFDLEKALDAKEVINELREQRTSVPS